MASVVFLFFLAGLASLSFGTERGDEVPKCPQGSSHLTDDSGEPLRCLPHHTDLCLRASKGRPIDGGDICCHNNRIDYYCCIGMSRQDCPDYTNVTVLVFREQKQPFVPNTLFPVPQGPDRPAFGPQFQSIRGFPPGPQTKFGKQVPAARGSSFSPEEIARAPFNPPPERPPPGNFPVFAPFLELNAPGPVVDPSDLAPKRNGPAPVSVPASGEATETPTKLRARIRLRKPPPAGMEPKTGQQPEFALQDDAMIQEQAPPLQEPGILPQQGIGFGQPPGDPLPPSPQPPGIMEGSPSRLMPSQPQWRPDPRNIIPPTANQRPSESNQPRWIPDWRGPFPPASLDPRIRPQSALFSNDQHTNLETTTAQQPEPSQTLWKFHASSDGWKPDSDSSNPEALNGRPNPRFPSTPLNAAPPASLEVFHDDAVPERPIPPERPNLFQGSTISIGPGHIPNMTPTRFIGFSSSGYESARRRLRRK